jgi:cytochrome oxidase Cu insertion factor (SCO1/SenC/PrrC family)
MTTLLRPLAVGVVAAGTAVGILFATLGSGSGTTKFDAPPPGLYKGTELPGSIRIPEVTLPSYRGGGVSLRAQRGKVLVVTFLDSKCRTKCPIIAALIAHTWRLLSTAEKRWVRAYAISVNPLADTRSSVHRFLTANHAVGVLDWLVAPIPKMLPVWHAFFVLPATQTGSDDVHSVSVRVFDRRGLWVSDLSVGVDLTPANLAHDIRTALQANT